MGAGNEREVLLQVADQLSAELGHKEDGEILGVDSGLGGEDGAPVGVLSPEDELLVKGTRQRLARIAAALNRDDIDGASERAVGTALDGIELVIRGELMMGNTGQLPILLPGFVFLVALPVVDQDRALKISRRAAKLVERAMG